MDGQAPLYAAIVAVLYIVAEILKVALQHWRDKQKELERVDRERQAEIERAAREREAAEKVAAEAKEVKEALAAAADKQDKVVAETQQIHKAVNSNWSTMKVDLDFANNKIDSLTETIEKANLVKANERIAGLEALLQKVLKTNGIHSEPKPPSDLSQLTLKEGEVAQVAITKKDV